MVLVPTPVIEQAAFAALTLHGATAQNARPVARSIALAERLGARLDPGAATFESDKPIHVYRHPRPEVRQ